MPFFCLVCFHYFVCCYGGCSPERKWPLGGWVVARKQIFMGIDSACFLKESPSLTHCRLQRFCRVRWLSRWCTFYLFYTSKWWLQKTDIWLRQNDFQSTANKQKPFPLWPFPYMWYYTDDTVYYEDLGRQYISVKKWINSEPAAVDILGPILLCTIFLTSKRSQILKSLTVRVQLVINKSVWK